MKQGVFKYIFVLGFIILLIVTYIVFYDKNKNVEEVQDQTSTVSTLITDLRLGIAGFDTMNPVLSNNKNVKEISRLIFDSLITIGENYSLEYGLATEIAKSDNLTYIIKLRENVKWQDGTEFTAQDVKYTVDTIKSGINSIYSANLQYVNGLEVVDDHTIRITLSQEVDFFEYNLTFPILSLNYFNGVDFVNTDKNNTIIGTGMFKIAEKTDTSFKLLKNEDYWNKNKDSLIKEIDINLYSNMGDMYTSFKTGYIDIIDVSISNVQDYIGSLGYNEINYNTRNVNFLCFNTQNEILVDSGVRKAISLLLDKNNILANLGSGYAISNFALDSKYWLYNNKLNIEYNSEEADNLLTAAGWNYTNNTWVKNGKVLRFSITVDSTKSDRVTAANIIADQLGSHGIGVTVKTVSNAIYVDNLNNKNYEVILTGMQMGYSPKISVLFADNNIANYSNTAVNDILTSIKNVTDYNVQLENYSKLFDEFLKDMPYIFLYRETDSVIYNQTLCGKITPNDYSIFYNIEKWYRQ